MPFVEDNKYKIFSFGKTYTVKSGNIEKLKGLESYRPFIWSNRPYIWLAIIIFSSLLSGVLSYLVFHNFEYVRLLIIWLSITIYIIIVIVYYIKIRSLLE